MISEQGYYPSTLQIMNKLGSDSSVRSRSSVEFVNPTLWISKEEKVYTGKKEEPIFLFSLTSEPLISQLIHLKPFFAPENKNFFVQWIYWLSEECRTDSGRSLLFGGSHEADLWFETKQPSFEAANPLNGVLETIDSITRGF